MKLNNRKELINFQTYERIKQPNPHERPIKYLERSME